MVKTASTSVGYSTSHRMFTSGTTAPTSAFTRPPEGSTKIFQTQAPATTGMTYGR